MKKIIFAIGLFLVLIGIWSFSWASTDTLTVDTSACGSSLGSIDCTSDIETNFLGVDISSLDCCLIYIETYSGDDYVNIFFADYPFSFDSSRNVITAQFGCVGVQYFESNGEFAGTLGFDAEFFESDFCYDYDNLINLSDCVSNYIADNFDYTQSSYDDEHIIINTTFFNNAYNYGDTGSGGDVPGDDPGDEPGDDNSNILSGLADILIHIVVPTSEQLEDLQIDFANTLLHPLGLDFTAWTFSSNLQYTQNEQGGFVGQPYLKEGIHYRFYFLNKLVDLDLSILNTMLKTPINYGSWHIQEESQAINQYNDIPTSRYYAFRYN